MKPGLLWSIALAMVTSATTPQAARLPSATVALRMDPRYTVEWVAQNMGIALQADVAMPTIHLASATPLRRFQDAVEPQWRMRPNTIFNVYVVATNEIYLDDVSDYYRRRNRTLDESLAHELVHYLQVRYLRDDLATDTSELEATTIQQAFREFHASPAPDPPARGETPERGRYGLSHGLAWRCLALVHGAAGHGVATGPFRRA